MAKRIENYARIMGYYLREKKNNRDLLQNIDYFDHHLRHLNVFFR